VNDNKYICWLNQWQRFWSKKFGFYTINIFLKQILHVKYMFLSCPSFFWRMHLESPLEKLTDRSRPPNQSICSLYFETLGLWEKSKSRREWRTTGPLSARNQSIPLCNIICSPLQRFPDIEEWTALKCIGKGNYGMVILYEHNVKKNKVVVKKMNSDHTV
jgi:hypothetical protein